MTRPTVRLLAVLAVLAAAAGCTHSSPPRPSPSTSPTTTASAPGSPSASPSASASPSPSLPPPPGPDDSALRRLTRIASIHGNIAPKSIVSSQHGLFIAQSMMYRHTITVYNREHELVKTIPDTVDLAAFGYPQYSGTYRGAPVEAGFTHDGRYAYVSNYEMYGKGFSHPGHDACNVSSSTDRSFVYRIDMQTLAIDQVIQVGATPKSVAVTPDNRTVLVSNWCSFSLSIIDAASAKEVAQVHLGRHPRGIVINTAGTLAYVAVMGSSNVAVVDLKTRGVSWIRGVGASPRDVVLDPRTGHYMYVTLNHGGGIAKVDVQTRRVVTRASTGSAPRSITIADDGKSLYVVNYDSDTMSKVRTSDMTVIQTVKTNHHPIGITFDDATREVWVACYTGSILVFQDA